MPDDFVDDKESCIAAYLLEEDFIITELTERQRLAPWHLLIVNSEYQWIAQNYAITILDTLKVTN